MVTDLPRKFALRNAYFGMHGSVELRHGRSLKKRLFFCKGSRKSSTTKSLIKLWNHSADFVALLVLISNPPWFDLFSYPFLTRFYKGVFIRVFL